MYGRALDGFFCLVDGAGETRVLEGGRAGPQKLAGSKGYAAATVD
jgi:hypothetical protein